MKDYYKILEVNKDASPEIIAKVYKILAKKYHPDLQDDKSKDVSAEKFKEIAEAYEILSNEQKREEYNQQFENLEQENLVDRNDYETLKNYCVQLETELDNIKSAYSNPNNINGGQAPYNANTVTSQGYQDSINQTYNNTVNKAYNDAINKAYHDAYINNLKNLGYKIKYKKSFKETCKNILSLLITGVVVFIVFKIVWAIPSLKNSILSLFKI